MQVTLPAQASCPILSVLLQWYRVQRWGVRRTPGAARRSETRCGTNPAGASVYTTAGYCGVTRQRWYSRHHSTQGGTSHTRHWADIRSSKERNEQGLSYILPRPGPYKWVAFELPQLRYSLLLFVLRFCRIEICTS